MLGGRGDWDKYTFTEDAKAAVDGSSGKMQAAKPPRKNAEKTKLEAKASEATPAPTPPPTGDDSFPRSQDQSGDDGDNDDDGLGWLGEEDFDLATRPDQERRRTVDVKDLHKITGLSEISAFQKIIEQDSKISKDSPGEAPAGVRIPKPVKNDAAPRAPRPGSDQRMPRPLTESAREGRKPPPKGPKGQRSKSRPSTGRQAGLGRKSRPARANKPGPGGKRGRAVTYLVCDIYDRPFKLDPEYTYVIGREQNVSICLPDESVSRKHATILFENNHFIIEDARSRNGTYVNGRAITSTRLRDRDVIQIGPFFFRVESAVESAPPPSCGISYTSETRSLPSLPGEISARIEPTDVAELLLFINRTQRSGVVTLRIDRWVGRLFIQQGEVVHARAGKAIGDEALDTLLAIERGYLHFHRDENIRIRRSITRPTFDFIERALQDVVES